MPAAHSSTSGPRSAPPVRIVAYMSADSTGPSGPPGLPEPPGPRAAASRGMAGLARPPGASRNRGYDRIRSSGGRDPARRTRSARVYEPWAAVAGIVAALGAGGPAGFWGRSDWARAGPAIEARTTRVRPGENSVFRFIVSFILDYGLSRAIPWLSVTTSSSESLGRIERIRPGAGPSGRT